MQWTTTTPIVSLTAVFPAAWVDFHLASRIRCWNSSNRCSRISTSNRIPLRWCESDVYIVRERISFSVIVKNKIELCIVLTWFSLKYSSSCLQVTLNSFNHCKCKQPSSLFLYYITVHLSLALLFLSPIFFLNLVYLFLSLYIILLSHWRNNDSAEILHYRHSLCEELAWP